MPLPVTAPDAAALLLDCWQHGRKLDELPADCRPGSRAEAYQAQALLVAGMGSPLVGWKLAATSVAGQQHIGVDGPLAGRVLASRTLASDSTVSLARNIMRVAEAEFVLTLAQPLPTQSAALTAAEVQACLEDLRPAIEVPDSRFRAFTRVGSGALIAENACADWFILGDPVPVDRWQGTDLAAHAVRASCNGEVVAHGEGARVLGGPLLAATWLANELRRFGLEWQPGQWVATGTCLTPVPVTAGDQVRMDFGGFGSVTGRFSD